MANVTFNCTQCGQSLMIDETAAGTHVKCPTCAAIVRVPTSKPKPTAPPPPPVAPVIEPPPPLPGTEVIPPPAFTPAAVSPVPPVTAPGALFSYENVLRAFFLLALVFFFVPVVEVGLLKGNPQSPFDVALQATNKNTNEIRTLRELLLNGTDLAKLQEGKSMKVMLGVVLLWVTSIGFTAYCCLTAVSAFIFFGKGNAPPLLLKIALICAIQFVPLVIIGNSLIRSGALDGAGGGIGAAGFVTVAPTWQAWVFAVCCAVVLFWPALSSLVSRRSQ